MGIILALMPEPPRVRLLHWKAEEASVLIDILQASSYLVEYDEEFRPALMKSWREAPPDAFVIDLTRLPSHGREIAIALRQSSRTRQIPIIFCGGEKEKVSRTRSELPDAHYCNVSCLAVTMRKALEGHPVCPVRPVAMMHRYASRTTAQKLGILPSSVVALVDPPAHAEHIVGPLPPGVELREHPARDASIALCFVHDLHSLALSLSELLAGAAHTKLWILWRKGGATARGDVTDRLVRETALQLGLVDYKICSVNPIWSAMLFARKK